ncbi:MAG TPA: flagellar hook-associated protein FlgK [Herbaspirillum sp.]|nr:flagellar hook-associated protein FlgK [Herbaspirillum sp.]
MSNILSIGESALFAAQTQLATTSHNIANASTPGYSRQVVQQASAGGQNFGSGFIGDGTVVNSITRVSDSFLNSQVMSAQSSVSSYTAYTNEITQIDNVVGNSSAGLTTSLASFFAGLQSLTANPSSASSRQAALSGAQTLSASFQSLAATMTTSNNSVNSQITTNVQLANSYAAQISVLNASITQVQGATGQPANDLLDQRDQLVSNLNSVMKVSTVAQSNGSIDVFVANGQPLVMGATVSTLTAVPSKSNPSNLEVGITAGSGAGAPIITLPDSSITGGTLGGLLDYRTQSLQPAQNQLGQIATVLASNMNAQNQLGLDQNGNPGGNFFTVSPPTVIGQIGNSATATVTATVTNASQLTTSDYQMSYNGTNYTITRLSDGTATTIPGPPTAYPSPPPQIDGVTFSAPTMAAGDSFLIQPTANAAATFSVALAGTSAIAAAAPITTAATTTTAAATANTGTGTIKAGPLNAPATTLPLTATFGTPSTSFTLTNGAGTPISAGVTINGVAVSGSPITYTAGATVTYQGASFVLGGAPAPGDSFTMSGNTGTGTISPGTVDKTFLTAPPTLPLTATFGTTVAPALPTTFTLTDGTGTAIAAGVKINGVAVAGSPINYTPGATVTYQGVSFVLAGAPGSGDSFTVSPTTNATQDSRNMQLMAALQTSNAIGQTTLQGAYSTLVSAVGNKTSEVQTLGSASQSQLTSVTTALQSETGVNSDQELANMIRYQTAYQAGAKVIQAASTMFTVLFALN